MDNIWIIAGWLDDRDACRDDILMDGWILCILDDGLIPCFEI